MLFIGLMSGTSMDGIDAAAVDFSGSRPSLTATHQHAYSDALRTDCLSASANDHFDIGEARMLSIRIGESFADAVTELLAAHDIAANTVTAIGSHGQTIRHAPLAPLPYTLQLGDPHTIASRTHITTVADFRSRDMTEGGQGAPLAPLFHRYLIRESTAPSAFVNIGGIANLSIVSPDRSVIGFDTGPGNGLMDLTMQTHHAMRYDDDGAKAATGAVIPGLLETMLADAYFTRPPPKSTGREYFNAGWLAGYFTDGAYEPADILRTLCALTAESIARALHEFGQGVTRLYVCGGGARNPVLMQELRTRVGSVALHDSEELGAPGDWMEAMAFAWLARECLAGRAAGDPTVTGARRAAMLGVIYPVG